MVSWSDSRWILIGILASLYVVMCARVARRVARTGRSFPAWFFISLVLTAVPAAVVLLRHQFSGKAAARGSPSLNRCRHCGHLLEGGPSNHEEPVRTCPNCNMRINEETLA